MQPGRAPGGCEHLKIMDETMDYQRLAEASLTCWI
jgi:hypothetical protein